MMKVMMILMMMLMMMMMMKVLSLPEEASAVAESRARLSWSDGVGVSDVRIDPGWVSD